MLVTLDRRHPLWSIIRMAVLGAVAIGVLKVTATNFDMGEMKAVGGVALASVVFDALKRALAKEV